MLPNDALIGSHMAAILAAFDAGAGPGRLKFYTGPAPARGAAITTQSLLGESVLSQPCGTVSGLFLDLTNPGNVQIVMDGIIGWARGVDGDGGFVSDFTVGLVASGADFEFSRLDVVAGGYLDWQTARIGYIGVE